MEMKVGLLWYDDNRERDIEDIIEACARRYYEKFGIRPDTCYVNPATLSQRDLRLKSNIQVKTAVNILPNHFWLGVARSKTAKGKKRR